jgi:hypothetical protein
MKIYAAGWKILLPLLADSPATGKVEGEYLFNSTLKVKMKVTRLI